MWVGAAGEDVHWGWLGHLVVRDHLARAQLPHTNVHGGVLNGLDVLLALHHAVTAWQELVAWALGVGAVDAKELVLEVHHVAVGNTDIGATHQPQLMTALLAVLKLDGV